MTEQACPARKKYPYLFDWTDEADEWHDEGEVRPTFGQVTQNCLRADGHDGEHEWPETDIWGRWTSSGAGSGSVPSFPAVERR